jgi:hypothetical protein
MPLPSNPPPGTLPPGFKTWGDNVAGTAGDHESRVASLELGIPAVDAEALAGHPALTSTYARVITPQKFGAVGNGATDDTVALQAFFDACNPDVAGATFGYIPPGWYRATQLAISSGSVIRGAGWGFMGTMWGGAPGGAGETTQAARNFTLLHQLSGVNDHFITMTNADYVNPVTGQRWFGPLYLSDMIVQGHPDNTTGSGIVFRDEVDIGALQDQVILERLWVSAFAVDGIHVPGGAMPLNWQNLSLMMNGRYGLNFEADVNAQAISLSGISGDSNGTALIRIAGMNDRGSVVLTNVKSEQLDNAYRGGTGTQHAVMIDECDSTPIHIDGLTHISARPDGVVFHAPTPAIHLASATTKLPDLTWDAVAVRVRDTDTSPTQAGVLRDAVGSLTLPITYRHGRYGKTSNVNFAEPMSLPASRFTATTGTPALGLAGGGRRIVMLFDAAADELATTSIVIPAGWYKTRVTLLWVNAGAGAGDVVWTVQGHPFAAGDTLNVADGTNMGGAATTAAAQDVVVATGGTAGYTFATTPGAHWSLRVKRSGTAGTDTLANDAGLWAVKLERAA